MNRSKLVLGLGLLSSCMSWPSDDQCLEDLKAVNEGEGFGRVTAKLVCQDSQDRVTWLEDDPDCLSVVRQGTWHKIFLDLAPLGEVNADDYRLFGVYYCEAAPGGQSNSSSYLEEMWIGPDYYVVRTNFDAVACEDQNSIELELYLANYRRSFTACKESFGAWNISVDFLTGETYVEERGHFPEEYIYVPD